jgi:superfamily II DNA helicase RecQ
MRLHFVTVPLVDPAPAEAELNAFLAAHRVMAIDRQLVVDGSRSVWAVCVVWTPGATPAPADAPKKASAGTRIDYREVLPEAQFAVFVRLRDLRKALSERDGVPPYAVFTNEQLADIVRKPVRTLADLGSLDGVGPSRVEQYGRAVLDLLAAAP